MSEDLEVLVAMVEDGALRPVIDSTYPLPETAAALRHIEAGHARGKVVVVIDGHDETEASVAAGAGAALGAVAAGAGR